MLATTCTRRAADDVYVERCPRLEKVTDGLFEREEAVLHVMGDQIREAKRRSSRA
jgi:hypothetical protein